MKPSHLLLCLVSCAAWACKEQEEPGKATPTATATSTSAPAASATSATGAGASDDGEGIPTEEDFEDEAEQKITSQNAEDELDKLEREISN
jgi:hypothetical protein